MAHLTQSHSIQAQSILKPVQPKKPARSFLPNARSAKASHAQTPPTPAKLSPQFRLKQRYALAKSELQHVYLLGQPHRSHTLAEQALFVQSYRSVLDLLNVFYAQAAGQVPRETEQQLQQQYAQAMELLKLFYEQAQQPPDAWKQGQRLFFDLYVRAQEPQELQKPQLQQAHAPVPAVTPSVPSNVPQTPAMTPPRVPSPARPLTTPAPATPVSSPDQAACRPWSPEELRKVQQAMAHASVPPQAGLPSPAQISQVVPSVAQPSQQPPMIVPANAQVFSGGGSTPQNAALGKPLPAQPAQAHVRQTEDSRSQQRYQRDRHPWNPNLSRRDYLIHERAQLEREVERVLGHTDALNHQWQFLEERKAHLTRDKALVPAKETLSFVVRRLIKIPLPSAARQVSYQQARLQQEEVWLHKQILTVNARYETLLREITIIDTELAILPV